MCPKYSVLDMIQMSRWGSFASVIRFWILVKKRNILFRIENPDLDLSKEINALDVDVHGDDDDNHDDDDDDNDNYVHQPFLTRRLTYTVIFEPESWIKRWILSVL